VFITAGPASSTLIYYKKTLLNHHQSAKTLTFPSKKPKSLGKSPGHVLRGTTAEAFGGVGNQFYYTTASVKPVIGRAARGCISRRVLIQTILRFATKPECLAAARWNGRWRAKATVARKALEDRHVPHSISCGDGVTVKRRRRVLFHQYYKAKLFTWGDGVTREEPGTLSVNRVFITANQVTLVLYLRENSLLGKVLKFP
jgi:hypothetical protein